MADPLTGLLTASELKARLGETEPLALWIDIDSLIWLNDQFGHEQGDRAIVQVAQMVARCAAIDEHAILARTGGDELLLVIGSSSVDDALHLAATIIDEVRALAIPYRRHDRPERDRLEVNVVVLRLTRALTARALGERAMTAELRERMAVMTFERKQACGGRPGVVADASTSSFWRDAEPEPR